MSRKLLSLPILLLLLAWGLPPTAHADGIEGSITARVEGENLTVGDPFWYIAEITAPETGSVQLPGTDTQIGPFEIRDYDEKRTVTEQGTQKITLRYQLVDFEVGEKQIADFSVPVEGQVDGETVTEEYLAPPVKVTINSVLPKDAKKLKPIYGPIMLLPSWYRYVKPALIGLLVLAALLVGIVLWRRRFGQVPEAEEPALNFHEHALADLEALANGDALQRGDFKTYYSDLGDTLRRWLQGCAGIQAMEETTVLIRYDLRRTDFPTGWQEDVLELLGRADLVKFAKWRPSESQANDDLETARELIIDQAPPIPRDKDDDRAREVA